MKLRYLALAIPFFLTALPACGDNSEEPDNAEQAFDKETGLVIEKLSLTGDDRTTLEEGHSTQLYATLHYTDGTQRDITDDGALWSSSDTSKAVISRSGLLTGLRAGRIEVSVTYNGITQTDRILITRW